MDIQRPHRAVSVQGPNAEAEVPARCLQHLGQLGVGQREVVGVDEVEDASPRPVQLTQHSARRSDRIQDLAGAIDQHDRDVGVREEALQPFRAAPRRSAPTRLAGLAPLVGLEGPPPPDARRVPEHR